MIDMLDSIRMLSPQHGGLCVLYPSRRFFHCDHAMTMLCFWYLEAVIELALESYSRLHLLVAQRNEVDCFNYSSLYLKDVQM